MIRISLVVGLVVDGVVVVGLGGGWLGGGGGWKGEVRGVGEG